MAVKAAEEIAHCTRPHGVTSRVSLSLDVYPVQSKSVLIDYPIHTAIAAAAENSTRIGRGATVAHCQEQIHNQAFKKIWRGGSNPVEHFLSQGLLDLTVGGTHNFIWRLLLSDFLLKNLRQDSCR